MLVNIHIFMVNQYFNFYYDPVRQGYDTSTWATLAGVPAVVGGKLVINNASIMHFADLMKGEAEFIVKLSAPAAGDSQRIGFTSSDAWLWFNIVDDVLSAVTKSGDNTNSVVIDWQNSWSDVFVSFKIKWEAGMTTFSIGDTQQAVISDASIPGGPLSLYVYSSSTTPITISSITVKGVESSTLDTGVIGAI